MRTIFLLDFFGPPVFSCLSFFFCASLWVAAPALGQGFAEPWDVTAAAKNLVAQTTKLQPLLEQLKPQEWQSKGAPGAYVPQVRGAREEVGYLIGAAQSLERQPDKLSLAIETYFRLQSVETQVNSLVDGVRRYQNPSLGDQLVTTMSGNFTNRDELREYISDLAKTREQEFKIADSEAQRCRGTLLRQPKPSAPSPGAKPATVPNPNQPNGAK